MLVAPLDWGLGHATRCIPLINELLKQQFDVLLVAEKDVATLLQNEFPSLKLLPLSGYNVKYSKNKYLFGLKMLWQLPKIYSAVKHEQRWLQKAVIDYNIDIVISDNRLGMYCPQAKCIFITHQLAIQTGNSITNWLVQKINYHFIQKYNECWVPDVASDNNMAGVLAHPQQLPKLPVHYIGNLSRLVKNVVVENIEVLMVLSGPEPQRTMFENILLQQCATINKKMILVRGLPNATEQVVSNNPLLQIINFATAATLNTLMLQAKLVVARSGYSTIMDVAALQKKAIFVPTPGQTEQQYLATYMASKKYAVVATQHLFSLTKLLAMAAQFTFEQYPTNNTEALQKAIAALK